MFLQSAPRLVHWLGITAMGEARWLPTAFLSGVVDGKNIDPLALSNKLNTTRSKLAATLGLSRDAVSKRDRFTSVSVQARLRDRLAAEKGGALIQAIGISRGRRNNKLHALAHGQRLQMTVPSLANDAMKAA